MTSLNNKANNKGFSLLELSVALVVLVILMVTTVNIVKSTREYDHLLNNDVYMNEVRSALMMFVRVNSFLPCPDSNGDGKEDRQGGSNFECTTAQGKIPYLDLGVAATDVWGQPLLYAVNAEADSSGHLGFADDKASARYFDRRNPPAFSLDTYPLEKDGRKNYRVCGEITSLNTGCSSTGTENDEMLEFAAIAVVVSFGENGAAAWHAFDSKNRGGLDDAEFENVDGDQQFWKGSGSRREGQTFDDQLFWILGGDVKYAIISSGGQL